MNKTISIIIPCFNESACLQLFFNELQTVCNNYSIYNYEFIFVNDGSSDASSELLNRLASSDNRVTVLEFSRNFGKEAALTAGFQVSNGDMVIPIDADLQHPPHIIFDLIDRYNKGDVDVVIALRNSRETESWLYKKATTFFYHIENIISDCDMPRDAGDFRLMSREVVEALCALPEKRRFMKGLYAWVGFRTATIRYDVKERIAGTSKFSFLKLLSLATNGILDFSVVPLRIWMFLGMIISGCTLIYGIYIVIKTFIFGIDIPGYASLITTLLFLGGIQLISIGVLGEYIGRIYTEIKGRPTYIIKKIKKTRDNLQK